jgi:hypothetical protein
MPVIIRDELLVVQTSRVSAAMLVLMSGADVLQVIHAKRIGATNDGVTNRRQRKDEHEESSNRFHGECAEVCGEQRNPDRLRRNLRRMKPGLSQQGVARNRVPQSCLSPSVPALSPFSPSMTAMTGLQRANASRGFSDRNGQTFAKRC